MFPLDTLPFSKYAFDRTSSLPCAAAPSPDHQRPTAEGRSRHSSLRLRICSYLRRFRVNLQAFPGFGVDGGRRRREARGGRLGQECKAAAPHRRSRTWRRRISHHPLTLAAFSAFAAPREERFATPLCARPSIDAALLVRVRVNVFSDSTVSQFICPVAESCEAKL